MADAAEPSSFAAAEAPLRTHLEQEQLAELHHRRNRVTLLEQQLTLARGGFAVSPRLATGVPSMPITFRVVDGSD